MHTREDFLTHVQKTHTCWLWTASITDHGYGQLRWHNSQRRYAHHVAWELYHGPIPDGAHVCHTCDVKHCVNPSHLYLGSPLHNSYDFMTRQWHKHNTRKLTPDDVRRIRELGKIHSVSHINRAYYPQMEHKAIRRILSGEYWQHVK